MREIKFRGKRDDGEGWVYGCLINNYCHPIQGTAIVTQGCIYYDVYPKTIGQYTGFKKTSSDGFLGKAYEGQEIYEGDVFRQELEFDRYDKTNYLVVTWIQQRGAFYLVDICHYQHILDNSNFEKDEDYSWLFESPFLYDFSIHVGLPYVGNIFDNLELLEK